MNVIALADLRGRWLPGVLFALVLLAMILVAAPPRSGAAPGQMPLNPGWKAVTLLYNSDVGGKIDPCG